MVSRTSRIEPHKKDRDAARGPALSFATGSAIDDGRQNPVVLSLQHVHRELKEVIE